MQVHAIIPAAGASRRLEGHIKVLSRNALTGKSLLQHCLDAICDLHGLESVTLVLGPPHGPCIEATLPAAHLKKLHILRHTCNNKGLGDSIALAVSSLPECLPDSAFLILLPDQPELSPKAIATLCEHHDFSNFNAITTAQYTGETWGPPLLAGSAYRKAFEALNGAQGAKAILLRNVHYMQSVVLPDFTGVDLDTLPLLQSHGWEPFPVPTSGCTPH
ncbi:MAG: NTP transferase domain-containing protein [Puniceicoccaceae bacterium]